MDPDITTITIRRGKMLVSVPSEDFHFILVSAQAELSRHRHEWGREPHARPAAGWTNEMLQSMF